MTFKDSDSHSGDLEEKSSKRGAAKAINKAKGRKDASKQEAVIEPKVLKTRMPELVKLKKAADSAAEEFNDAVKAAAEKSGLLASVVRRAAVASAGEDFEAKHREVEQLQLAFDAVA